jgi:predicted PurR-regulated permease PerM
MSKTGETDLLSRRQMRNLILIAASLAAVYLSYIIALPFLASLVWALALAVLVFPVYREIRGYLKNDNVAAAFTTFAVAVLVVVPVIVVGRQVAREVWGNIEYVRNSFEGGEWRSRIGSLPYGERAIQLAEEELDLNGAVAQAANLLPGYISGFLSGSIWLVVQLLITFFALFFFLRDHKEFLEGVRRLVPLTEGETDSIFKRIVDTLHATVFGEILIALLQGILGGLMFWLLGLPAPVLWGFVIAVMAFMPVVGTWMIWFPAAVYLMIEGEWIRGIVLIVWGVFALMVLSTLLYPVLVGNRLRMHTLLVFIAIIGGILAFGTVGIILGPLIVALTVSLIDLWKKRMGETQPASSV